MRRRDVLTRTAADAACALFWFHPGVWMAARRMRAEAERACDDAVLAAGVPRIGYAEALVALAATASGKRARAVGHVGATSGAVSAPFARMAGWLRRYGFSVMR